MRRKKVTRPVTCSKSDISEKVFQAIRRVEMNRNRKETRLNSQQKNSTCYYFKRGYCRFGNRCRYRHDQSSLENSISNAKSRRELRELSKGKICGICFEEVISKKKGANKFGILPNCKHCFCFPCIKIWRSSVHFEDEVTKSCPECRVNSIYVYKNSFWIEDEVKNEFIVARNEKLANINCKYYRGGRGVCRLGDKCLFRHVLNSNPSLRHQREQSYFFKEDNDDIASSIIRLVLFGDSLTDEDIDFGDSDIDDVELEAFYLLDELL